MELSSQQQQLGVLVENFVAHERKLEAFGTALSRLQDQLHDLISDLAWDRARLTGMYTATTATASTAAVVEPDTTTAQVTDLATIADGALCVPTALAAVAAAALIAAGTDDAVAQLPEMVATTEEAAEITPLLPAVQAVAEQALQSSTTEIPAAGLAENAADEQPTLTLAEATEQMTSVRAFETSDSIPAIPQPTVSDESRLDLSGIDLANIETAVVDEPGIDSPSFDLAATEPGTTPDHPTTAADGAVISLVRPTPAADTEPQPAKPTLDATPETSAANTNVVSLAAHRNKRFSVLPRAASVAVAMLTVTICSLLYGNDTLQAELAEHLSQISACSVAAIATNQDCAALAWLSL